MGSCGSSLNCNKCYANEPIDGCDTEIEIDPDIAGIGVLVSFLFCAFGLSAVIVWGYFNECLPPDVLSPTDHYALQSLKKRRRPFVEADLRFEPTPKQKERTQVIVGFVTVLSDQQLVTGVAILIAGLASRCRISFYEFNIVTYLAYFATFTHALSLGVLQSHLFARKLARDCRVVFTVGFLAIFGFSFIVNTVSSDFDDVIDRTKLNKGNVIQCLFEAARFGKSIQFDIATSIVVLGLILANHTTAILELYFEPEASPIARMIQLLCVYGLRCKGFSEEDASTILTKAESKYDAWLQPPLATDERTKISIWFFYEKYYDSYLSVVPQIMLGTTYGIGSVVIAVWYGGLKLANGLQILGFGQIVAMVLLALTLLAVVEVMSEQKHLKTHLVSGKTLSVSEAHVTESETTVDNSEGTEKAAEVSQNSESVLPHPNSRFWWSGVCFGPPKSQEQLDAIRAGELSTHDDDIYTAREMGNLALAHCCFETCLSAFIGIGYNFTDTGASASFSIFFIFVVSIYISYRSFIMTGSLMNQIKFIRYEARLARNQERPESQLSILHQSNQSLDPSVPPSDASIRTNSPFPSRPANVMEQRSTAREGQAEFGPPGRIDTEADIGLVPLARRRTNPPPLIEQGS